MPRYLVQVLGPPVVTDTRSGATVEFPAGKTLALLCYLVLHAGAPLREQLYRLLWADSPRDRGLQSVRQALWLIRHAFGETALGGRDGTALDRELLVSDVALLREAIAGGRVEEAERLWRGPFLDRFAVAGAPAWDQWVEETRAGLERDFGAALAAAAAGDSARGDTDSALRRYTAAIQLEPFRLEYRLAAVDLLLELRRGPDAEQALDAARSALPEPEFAAALAERETRLREVLRDRALEPIAALSRPELVGRAQELSDLIGRWNLVRRGRTQRVVLHGRSGVGKTRLAEELAAVVEQDHGRAVVVRTTEPESGLPWATIVTLVRRLLVLPGASGISAGSDAVLRRLVPSLARHATSEYGSGGPQPAVLADALADLLGAVAYEAPLQVVLDDAQWIDPDSWALLSRLLTQIETDPVFFLLTVRDGETAPAVERALARIKQGVNALSVRLANLSRAETAELLTYVLGSEQATDGIGERIYAATRGNPLFIVETTKMLRDVGALRLSGERWVFDAARVPEHFPLPASIEQLLRKRVERLSPTAERIARLLAQRGTPQDIADLQPAGVPRTVWADAIGELVDRGVVLRTEEGYALAHEQIAAVVRAGPWRRVRRRWVLAAAAALVLVVVGAATAVALRPWESLYGGGSIYFRDDAGFARVRPPARLFRDWRLTRTVPYALPEHADFRSVRRTADGRLLWTAAMMPPDSSPYPLELREGGPPRVLFRSTTDVEVTDVSPAGDRFLIAWDDPVTPKRYDIQAATLAPGTGRPRVIYRLGALTSGMSWSPDGQMIAIGSVGPRDSLHVLTPEGGVLRQYDVGRIGNFAWCADRTIIMVPSGEPLRVRRFFTDRDSVLRIASGAVLDGQIFCAPDSRHALIHAPESGLKRVSLLDLQTGNIQALPGWLQGRQPWAWIPDTIPPLAHELRLDQEQVRLSGGGVYRPTATVIYTDGKARPETARLSVSDSSVITVLADGGVMALRPGRAVLYARYRDWLRDSAVVTVDPGNLSTLLHRDSFPRLDPRQWRVVGTPAPTPARAENRPVLRLTGDGNYEDGLISRFVLPGDGGLTVELDVRFRLNREDKQRLRLGLCHAQEPPDSPDLPLGVDDGGSVFIRYPPGEFAYFHPSQVTFSAFGFQQWVPVGPALPSGGWTHLAIQLRPNGYAELVVNRRVVNTSVLRHPDPAAQQWRICIFGAAVDTELLIRDLRVWRGLQYWPPRAKVGAGQQKR